jgi:Recombinase/Recombinase zinc beta ribbon domain
LRRLNEAAIRPPDSDRRRGSVAWTKSSVWSILRNAAYVGTATYDKARYSEIGKKRGKLRRPTGEWVIVEGAVTLIVSPELWQAAQAKHGTRRFGIGRPWHRPYLLSGLIECAHCGKRFWANKQSRGLIEAYYVCGGYVTSGLTVCDGLRVAAPYLDDAVLDGIQKRLDRILDRDTLRASLRERLRDHDDVGAVARLEGQLADMRRRIARLVEVASGGADDLPSVRDAFGRLERERRSIEDQLHAARTRVAQAGNLDATLDAMIDALSALRAVVDTGDAEERKALVRVFLAGIRVDKKTRQAVLRWHRLPRLGDASVKLVELRGFEPLTPRLPEAPTDDKSP